MRRLKIFIINTIILVITSVFIRTISIFFDIYIANTIGSEGIGLFNLIMSVYFLAITIASSGINLASTRIVSEEIALNKQTGAKIAISKCIKYSTFFGLLSAFILILLAPFICHNFLHDKIRADLLYIIAVSLPFSSIASSITGYFIGIKKVSKNSSYEIFNTFLKIIITFLLIKTISPSNIEFSCFILVVSNTISEIISFAFLYILYIIDLKHLKTNRLSSNGYLIKILRISLPVAITSYIRSGLSTIKHLLIPMRLEKHGLTCDQAISSYGLINGMAMPLLMFPGLIINSVSSLLIPEFSRYNAKKDFNKMREVINTMFSLSIIFSTFVVIVYILFHDIISQFTYGNLEIANYLLMLSPLMLFMYLDHIVDAILKGIDKQVSVMYCNIIDLFMSIFLIYTLIPVYGINAYIFILYFSEIFNFSISLLQLRKATGFSFNLKNGIKSAFLAVLKNKRKKLYSK